MAGRSLEGKVFQVQNLDVWDVGQPVDLLQDAESGCGALETKHVEGIQPRGRLRTRSKIEEACSGATRHVCGGHGTTGIGEGGDKGTMGTDTKNHVDGANSGLGEDDGRVAAREAAAYGKARRAHPGCEPEQKGDFGEVVGISSRNTDLGREGFWSSKAHDQDHVRNTGCQEPETVGMGPSCQALGSGSERLDVAQRQHEVAQWKVGLETPSGESVGSGRFYGSWVWGQVGGVGSGRGEKVSAGVDSRVETEIGAQPYQRDGACSRLVGAGEHGRSPQQCKCGGPSRFSDCKSTSGEIGREYVPPVWIPGSTNDVADQESRMVDYHDWRLSKEWFGVLDRAFGPHKVDRFADSNNNQVRRFNARRWCPGVEAVDAFAQQWSGEINWAVPPAGLLLRVFWHPRATVVAPMWPGQPWWPLLCRLQLHRSRYRWGHFRQAHREP
eukprot:c2537_g1_i1.p1 GENE.c2537_g1_i1~~c2537_g1_i1.p1  ORF type:complete len:441 (+),score=18.45 c2537_g1_i1:246-1568(+)